MNPVTRTCRKRCLAGYGRDLRVYVTEKVAVMTVKRRKGTGGDTLPAQTDRPTGSQGPSPSAVPWARPQSRGEAPSRGSVFTTSVQRSQALSCGRDGS